MPDRDDEHVDDTELEDRLADDESAAEELDPRAESDPEEDAEDDAERLYFFPEDEVSEEELTAILASDDRERRAWAVSHLLRYAQWDDIWAYVDRDAVREIFPDLDLPENLRTAWARMLKIEASVG